MLIKGKYPYKNNTDIKELLESKLSGLLLEEEAVEIVKYMYSPEDSQTIIGNLNGYLKNCNSFIKE
jgi:hypothetical protein